MVLTTYACRTLDNHSLHQQMIQRRYVDLYSHTFSAQHVHTGVNGLMHNPFENYNSQLQ
jgi:hypothetical protein